jgi:Reverse transcriptase (RNA-dependent DNA polymerase)
MIPYEKRKKLDDKAKKVKFVGYDENSKGYRFVDENYKLHVSREAKFLKEKGKLTKSKEQIDECNYFEICLNNFEPEQQEEFFDAENSLQDDSLEENSEEENSLEEQNFVQKRSTRSNLGTLPSRFEDYVTYKTKQIYKKEPTTFNEVLKRSDCECWINAMKEELISIENNQTWELTELPEGRKAIGSKWVYKIKEGENKDTKYKARLVAQGFSQKYGIDYDEVFAPVARTTTLRILLSLAGKMNYIAKHYDIKTAFLNGTLEEEIYMKQPPGFSNGSKVYKLKKSIYGLKQSAKVWNDTLNNSLLKNGMKRSEADKCLYAMNSGGEVMYLLVHVDDILVIGKNVDFMDKFMTRIGKDFDLKDLGIVKNYLGINVERDNFGNYSICQSNYIEKIINEAGLCDAKESSFPMDVGYYKLDGELLNNNDEYRKLIGMLLFVATHTRPDIAASVSILSQKVSNPRNTDMNEVKRMIRYLKGTKYMRLCLSIDDKGNLIQIYSDANWAEDRNNRKSNTGYFCALFGGAISWMCRKQDVVALSSTEAEFIALSETCKEVIWIKRLLKELQINIDQSITILTDSQSSINMINNEKFSNRTKHIDTRYHFIKEAITEKEVCLKYIKTDINVADLMTKPLNSIKMKQFRPMIGLFDRGGVLE